MGGRVYQKYADAVFKAASHRLGRWVAAPQVLHAFDDEQESVPVLVPVASQPPPAAYATDAASKSSHPPLPTSSSYNWNKLVFADFGELQPLTDLITHLFHRL